MTDRPKNHFRRLVPYGLIWGFFTGVFVHILGSGFTWVPGTVKYWATFALIWTAAGLLWAYLTAKFSKRKTSNGKEVS